MEPFPCMVFANLIIEFMYRTSQKYKEQGLEITSLKAIIFMLNKLFIITKGSHSI